MNGEVYQAIKDMPGLRMSQIVEKLGLPIDRVEDAIWALWTKGRIQIERDSTLRVTREGEKVFRHIV